jgi:hypothetical protein
MATTAVPYSSVLTLMAEGGIGFMTNNAVAALCTSGYTPSQTGHSHFSDITNEVVDLSYARVSLASKAESYAAGTLTLSCADTTFPALVAPEIRYVIFGISDGVSDTTSPLLGYWDLGVNQAANVNDFTLIYHTAGFLTIAI